MKEETLKELKDYSGSYWLLALIIEETAKQVSNNNLRNLDVEFPINKECILKIKIKN